MINNNRKQESCKVNDHYIDRIHSALKIEKEIGSLKRLAKSDRFTFATALGKLFEKVREEMPDFSYATLFDFTFDLKTSQSLQKKRKTLILHSNEQCNSSGLTASPYKYLRIANKIDEILQDKLGTEKGYALAFLIEESSFDTQDSQLNRQRYAQRKSLRETLEKCVQKVRSAVDLKQMHDWLENANLGTKGGTAKVTEIVPFTANDSIPAAMSFFYDDMFNNAIAPCVRIGKLSKQLKTYFAFELGTENYQPTKQSIIDRLNQYLSEENLLKQLTIGKFNDYPKINANKAFTELEKAFYKKNIALEAMPIEVDINKFIDLEILFHNKRKEWLPYILERFESTSASGYGGKTGIVESLDSEGIDIFFIGELFSHNDLKLFAFNHKKQGDESSFIYFIMEDTDVEMCFYDPISIPLVPFQDDYFDFLYSDSKINKTWENSEIYLQYPIDALTDQPINTLAHVIMANLIFVESENNLLNKWVVDARAKYAILSKYINDSENEYKTKLDAFMNS